jgi:hypothetical protein
MTARKTRRPNPAGIVDADAARRSLLEALLATHSQLDVFAMLSGSVSGAGVTYEQIRYARKRMIREGLPVWVGPRASPPPRATVPTRQPRPAKIDPSELLLRALVRMFERKAFSLGCSVATAKILTLYSPAHIVRMNGAAAQGGL